ncbi:MAG: CPBP family glutamic-type intramembrane protease [Pirellulaceae bacterium]|jgi:membrane protease YdiL (CAAX protease family)|nr:CPBP family glutamic-type intramembrane protease [Pirellulaceae bacterium]
MQAALGIAGLVVMATLAGSLACWSLVGLKLLAVSRRAPVTLVDMARQVLLQFKIRPGLPLVLWQPRQVVPWTVLDLLLIVAVYIGGTFAVQIGMLEAGWLPREADEAEWTLGQKGMLVAANIIVSLVLLAIVVPLVSLRTGARGQDWGVSLRALAGDLRLGLIGFLLLAPPTYALQGLLVNVWKPSKHPLMEMFKDSPEPWFFVLLAVAAAVVAPLFEEIVFRVLLQGWLERVIPRFLRGPRTTENAAVPLEFMEPNEQQAGWAPLPGPFGELPSVAPEWTQPQPPDNNPYTSPAIEADATKPLPAATSPPELSLQPPLSGPAAWLPIAISATIFALLHYSHGPDWVPLTLLAVGMGYLYQRTHSLIPSLVVHTLLNSLSLFGLWLQVFVLKQ